MFMNYYCYSIFIPLILSSSMMIFLTNSWISMWMILEFNMISFISMLTFDKSMKNELPIMYFLIQSFFSHIFLMFSLLLNTNNFWISQISIIFMNLMMIMKMSIFPFHLWYMKMLNYMNWMNLFIFTTIQKIIPLYILNFIQSMNNNIYLFNLNVYLLIISSMFSSIYGLKMTSIKLIMSFSSMIQISWIIIMMMFNESMSLTYFMIYSLISMNLYYIFYSFNLNYLNELNFMKFKNLKVSIIMMINLMSLASVPPMFGFLMKWISLMNLMNKMNFMMLILFIFNSIISMYFYFRIMFNSLIIFYSAKKNNYKFLNFNYKYNKKFLIYNFIMILFIFIIEIY